MDSVSPTDSIFKRALFGGKFEDGLRKGSGGQLPFSHPLGPFRLIRAAVGQASNVLM